MRISSILNEGMTRVRALTFDLDDTLWDSLPVLIAAEHTLHTWLSQRFPRITRRYALEDLRRMRAQLAARHPEFRHSVSALRRESLRRAAESVGYDQELIEPAFNLFLDARHAITPYPDVAPVLQRLRAAGYLIGSLTNGNADVQRLEIGGFFHFSLSAESVGEAKPHPRMFEEACRQTGLSPAEMIHVGDEPATDLAGARAAGIKVVWMNRSGQAAHPQFPHHAAVRDMYGLLALLHLN